MLWMKSAPQRLLHESVLKLRVRVTPTRLCNHNNHNNVMSTRNQGQESNSLLQILLEVSGGVKRSDVQADCSITSERKLDGSFLHSCESKNPVFYATNPTRSESVAEPLVQLQQLHSISFSLSQLLLCHGTSCIHGMQAGRLRRTHIYSQEVTAIYNISTCNDCCSASKVYLSGERRMPAQKLPGTMRLPTPK